MLLNSIHCPHCQSDVDSVVIETILYDNKIIKETLNTKSEKKIISVTQVDAKYQIDNALYEQHNIEYGAFILPFPMPDTLNLPSTPQDVKNYIDNDAVKYIRVSCPVCGEVMTDRYDIAETLGKSWEMAILA